MSNYDYDLFVIGGGSGGVRAARVASNMGNRVGLAEMDRLGGTCVIRGCVPKKLFFYASSFSEHFADSSGYGWDVESRFDWSRLVNAKNEEISRLQNIYADNLRSSNVELFESRATVRSPHEVHLESLDRTITTERILIAVGGAPSIPEGLEGREHCLLSDHIFELPKLPNRIVINGGGYIAVEFAGIMNGLGVDTTLVYRGDKLLRGFDDDLRSMVHETYEHHGIKIVTNRTIGKVEKGDDGLVVHLDNQKNLMTDSVLMATGRAPRTLDLGLESVGVAMERGVISVDEFSRSSVPSIWAVGDVTNRKNLTPVAIHEAMCFCETEFGGTPRSPDYDHIATAIYTHPEIGTVGLSEEAAGASYERVRIFVTRFTPLVHTLSGSKNKMLMKLVVDGESDKVLGCHIMGAGADEMIQMLAVSFRCGVTKKQLDSTMAVHPTSAEELVTFYESSYELVNGVRV